MNPKVIDEIEKLVLKTDFANLFALPFMFNATAALFELKTDRFAHWLDSLKLPIPDNLTINSVNTKTDKEELYTYNDFVTYGMGELCSRSIAIPGFIDKGFYIDGGVANNCSLSQWKNETRPIFVSQLLHAHRTQPNGRIQKISYSFDFKSFLCYQIDKVNYPTLKTIYPDISEISSVDFGMNSNQKEQMIWDGYLQTMGQLKFLGIQGNKIPTDICLGLSGGGIRSLAHIGVVKALLENNFIPVQFSGTSGGAIVACLLAGYQKLIGD